MTHHRDLAINSHMQNLSNITILPAFGDNYIYLAEYAPGFCFAIDPGDADCVLDSLEQKRLKLTHILLTHHHLDHIGGVNRLKQKAGCTVIGPDPERIHTQDKTIDDGETLEIENTIIRCIATAGHTATSICYFVSSKPFAVPMLFSGDTLFAYGCGRISECDGQTMYSSLQKLITLPDDTLIYPGHDYTQENIEFALTVKPDDDALRQKLKEIKEKVSQGHPTVPSTLAEEKRLNPFLNAPDWKTFTTLRQKKDVF